jgi:hypothetical protein
LPLKVEQNFPLLNRTKHTLLCSRRNAPRNNGTTTAFSAFSSFFFLVNDGARVVRARDLGRGSDGEADAVVVEEGGRGARVPTQVEVDVGAVLVRVFEAILRAERVALSWTEVVDCFEEGSVSMLFLLLWEKRGDE